MLSQSAVWPGLQPILALGSFRPELWAPGVNRVLRSRARRCVQVIMHAASHSAASCQLAAWKVFSWPGWRQVSFWKAAKGQTVGLTPRVFITRLMNWRSTRCVEQSLGESQVNSLRVCCWGWISFHKACGFNATRGEKQDPNKPKQWPVTTSWRRLTFATLCPEDSRN